MNELPDRAWQPKPADPPPGGHDWRADHAAKRRRKLLAALDLVRVYHERRAAATEIGPDDAEGGWYLPQHHRSAATAAEAVEHARTAEPAGFAEYAVHVLLVHPVDLIPVEVPKLCELLENELAETVWLEAVDIPPVISSLLAEADIAVGQWVSTLRRRVPDKTRRLSDAAIRDLAAARPG